MYYNIKIRASFRIVFTKSSMIECTQCTVLEFLRVYLILEQETNYDVIYFFFVLENSISFGF